LNGIDSKAIRVVPPLRWAVSDVRIIPARADVAVKSTLRLPPRHA